MTKHTFSQGTLEYLPWAVLNYMGIVFAIILAITGFGVAYIDPEKKHKKETIE